MLTRAYVFGVKGSPIENGFYEFIMLNKNQMYS